MNNELKKFIEEKLGLENIPLKEKREVIGRKKRELQLATTNLEEYLTEETSRLLKPIKEIEGEIKSAFSKYECSQDDNDDYYDIILRFSNTITCTLSFIFDKCQYRIGVYPYASKDEQVTSFLEPLFKRGIIKEDSDWYGYKETSKEKAYDDFKELVTCIEKELNK
jgi:predicted DNA-binding transcriptional regulator